MQTMTAPTQTAAGPRHRRAWLALALSTTAFAVYEVAKHGTGTWVLIAFAVAPDLSFLAAAGQPTEPGRLAPHAVPIYNFVHHAYWPTAVLIAASIDLLPFWCFVAGLGWLAHISIDRTVGFGLRTQEGWQRD